MHEPIYEQAQQILIYVLMISFPMYLINRLHTDTKAAKLVVNIIVLMMCLCFSWITVKFCVLFYMLNGLFTVVVTVVLGLMMYMIYRLLREKNTNKRFVYLFLGYCVAIFVVTLFYRIGSSIDYIKVELMETLVNVATMQSPEELEHLLLNILMFVPMGALYPLMSTGKKEEELQAHGNALLTTVSKKYGLAGIFLAFSFSGLIESVQLILSMGECDVADIFGNGLGAIIGTGISVIIRRFIR